MKEWHPEAEEIEIRAYAEVAEDIEIHDQETLDRLREYHIWTDTFAEERLKWKRTKPLHLLLLRVSTLSSQSEFRIVLLTRDVSHGLGWKTLCRS